MKRLYLTAIILFSAGLLFSFGQDWTFTATKHNFAPYVDTLENYYPWQHPWLDCSIPITITYKGDTVYSSHETYIIEIADKDSSQIITMFEQVNLKDDVQYEAYDDGFLYASVSYDKNRRLTYSILKVFNQDSMEFGHINDGVIINVYKGLLETGKGKFPILPDQGK